jgi:hypothetical protein
MGSAACTLHRHNAGCNEFGLRLSARVVTLLAFIVQSATIVGHTVIGIGGVQFPKKRRVVLMFRSLIPLTSLWGTGLRLSRLLVGALVCTLGLSSDASARSSSDNYVLTAYSIGGTGGAASESDDGLFTVIGEAFIGGAGSTHLDAAVGLLSSTSTSSSYADLVLVVKNAPSDVHAGSVASWDVEITNAGTGTGTFNAAWLDITGPMERTLSFGGDPVIVGPSDIKQDTIEVRVSSQASAGIYHVENVIAFDGLVLSSDGFDIEVLVP